MPRKCVKYKERKIDIQSQREVTRKYACPDCKREAVYPKYLCPVCKHQLVFFIKV